MCNKEDFIDYPDYDEDSLDNTFEDLIYEMATDNEYCSCHLRKQIG